MGSQHCLFIILMALSSVNSATAFALEICESHASIIARADDEICDYHVEAAQSCFQKLNLRYAYLQRRGSRTQVSETAGEATSLKNHYEIGIATLRANAHLLKVDACGDQREALAVIVEELEADLKWIDKRIASLNDSPNK